MSAICGILRLDGIPVEEADLTRQIGSLRQFGPERSRTWRDGPIGMGHALMRVTKEDAFDAQPLVDRAAGLTLLANLRLDNREKLASALDLDAATLSRLPDSAVLMCAYKKWGEDCAEHLLGDFVFALWDKRARKLLLGRDHMGTRHLYYYRGADCFVFASEKKGLWAVPNVPRRLDDFEIGKLLTLDLSEANGATVFQDIFGLRGGTVMTVTVEGNTSSRRYWEPHADPAHIGRDESYYIDTYRRLLREAVECRMRRATRPVGLFMSGGFDSAAIAALAGPVMSAKQQKLIAVASVMPEGYCGLPRDARKWVDICQRHMPHLNVRYVTREGRRFLDDLEGEFLQKDTNSSPNRVANAAIYSAFAESGACVVMDGHGGDYTVNAPAIGWLAEQLVRGRLRLFFRELPFHRRYRNLPLWPFLKQDVIKPILPGWLNEAWSRFRNRVPLRGPAMPIAREFAESIKRGGASLNFRLPPTGTSARWNGMLATLLHLQEAAYCPGYAGAVIHGLEYTQPFHDKRLVEFGLAIPQSLFVKDGRYRYLARKALADLYPPEFQTRGSETDSRTPDFAAIAERSQSQMLAEIIRMEKRSRLTRLFDFARMREMLQPASGGFAAASERRMRNAIRCLIMARFIEWSERDNRQTAYADLVAE